jgi:putative membrane protein insertion efficiency factor
MADILSRAGHFLITLPEMLIIGAVRLYQKLIRPLLGPRCRFYPSCSEYFIGAVRKYGVLSGSARGVWRIMRCHPFHPGGYDPP